MSKQAIAATAAFLMGVVLPGGVAQAATAHEASVGAQVEQLCDARSLGVAGRFAHVAHFAEPPGGQAPDANAVIAASACQAAPALHARLVAVAWRTEQSDTKGLVVMAIDSTSGQVTSAYQGTLDEDAATKIVSGSLWLDTGAYDLQPGLRAFGLDVTSGARPDCADTGAGARRTLFVAQGRFIRPVLQDLPMSEWALIQRGRSWCTDSSAPEQSIVENVSSTLALAPTSTNGMRDLVVTAAATRDDGQKADRAPFRRVLKFDGRSYLLNELQVAWAAWRQ
jgi:hypothetical protein